MAITQQPSITAPALGGGIEGLSTRDIWNATKQGKWVILGVTLLMLAGSFIYTYTATPMYRSKELIQVSDKSEKSDEFSQLFTSKSPVETQMEIITSRSVIGKAVDRLNLDILAQPRYFPVIGKAIAKFHSGREQIDSPLWGGQRYAWGGEHIQVSHLVVPDFYKGQPFTLVAGNQGEYRLIGPDGAFQFIGHVGVSEVFKIKNANGATIEILVTELKARTGTEFRVVKRLREDIIDWLQGAIHVSEKGIEKGRPTGILQVTLEGDEPGMVAKVLNTLAEVYVQQNLENRAEEAERKLNFLNKQLPVLKANLDAAETALADYRAKHGGLDVTGELSELTTQMGSIEKDIMAAQMQQQDLRQQYGDRYPAVVAIDEKLKLLKQQRATVSQQLTRMPASAQTTAKLTRDVKVAEQLYMLLLTKAQELKLMRAGTLGDLRVLESALPPKYPFSPQSRIIMGFSLIAGLLLGLTVVLLRIVFKPGVDSATQIEHKLGLPVYGGIPHSKIQTALEKEHKKDGAPFPVLALLDPADAAIEGLRRVRTLLQYKLKNAQNKIISITSPAPGNGKSFISLNLAHIFSFAEKRVLLIDTDMRKQGVSAFFTAGTQSGLAEFLKGEVPLNEVIQKVEGTTISVLPTGSLPVNPSELLMNARFQALLQVAVEQYDLIILDTAPVLLSTDATIVGTMAGINLIVVRAGETQMSEIESSLKELVQNGVTDIGVILNDLNPSASSHSAYSYQYKSA